MPKLNKRETAVVASSRWASVVKPRSTGAALGALTEVTAAKGALICRGEPELYSTRVARILDRCSRRALLAKFASGSPWFAVEQHHFAHQRSPLLEPVHRADLLHPVRKVRRVTHG